MQKEFKFLGKLSGILKHNDGSYDSRDAGRDTETQIEVASTPRSSPTPTMKVVTPITGIKDWTGDSKGCTYSMEQSPS